MNRTILLAIGGLAAGLALGTVGTLLLGAARAVAKHVGSTHRRMVADLRQYAAAFCALVGFLLIAGGGGLLVRELVPVAGPARSVLAVGVGVLLFAAAGAAFSRVGDLAEEAKARKLPSPVYRQVRAPEPVQPVPRSVPPAPPTSAPPATVPPATVPPPTSAPPAAQVPAAQHVPATPVSAPPTPAPAASVPMEQPEPEAAAAPQPADPAQAAEPAPPAEEPATVPPATQAQATEAQPADEAPPAEDSPAGTLLADGEALLRSVRPGWVYRDAAERWYLGVVDEHTGGLPLLALPDFSLVAVAEPTYPLVVAGAGEIAVVPLPTVPVTALDDGAAEA